SSIHADAIDAGDGGKVVIWADGQTLFQGQVTARGGQTSGDGGFVEISGKANLRYDGKVNTTAPKGATGTLLLDPKKIRIVAGSGGTDDAVLSTKKQILAADQPDADMVISESKIETESINNDLAFEASMGISMLKLPDHVLGLANGITFQAEAGGFMMDGSDKIEITTFKKGLTLKSPTGEIKIGSITTNAGNVTIDGSQIDQPAGGVISTNQGNLIAKADGVVKLGRIETKYIEPTTNNIFNENQDQGNVDLASAKGDIIVISIDTSNVQSGGVGEFGRAGKVKVEAMNGVFRATGAIGGFGGENISINTSGNRNYDAENILAGPLETFTNSGIGLVDIKAKSSMDFFIAGAYIIPSLTEQREAIQLSSANRSLFENNTLISGSFGAVTGNSFNANLEAVISEQGIGNTDKDGNTLFTLNISKFPPVKPVIETKDQGRGKNQSGTTLGVGSGAGTGETSTAENKNSGSQDRKIEPSQNIQDLSNTKQLDQTASTTQCAEGSEKECEKEFNEALNPILDISAIKQK
ncbi:MAG: hypothetical protein ACKO45_02675, partial [Cyanobium sp.]